MGQVSITLNDRVYRLVCDDGEEDRLVELATYVKDKVAHLTAELGHAGDERLLLMAALMIADELWDARAALEAMPLSAGPVVDANEPEPVRRLKTLQARMSASTAEDGTQSAGPAKSAKRRDIA